MCCLFGTHCTNLEKLVRRAAAAAAGPNDTRFQLWKDAAIVATQRIEADEPLSFKFQLHIRAGARGARLGIRGFVIVFSGTKIKRAFFLCCVMTQRKMHSGAKELKTPPFFCSAYVAYASSALQWVNDILKRLCAQSSGIHYFLGCHPGRRARHQGQVGPVVCPGEKLLKGR
jgi:hypothetical protein